MARLQFIGDEYILTVKIVLKELCSYRLGQAGRHVVKISLDAFFQFASSLLSFNINERICSVLFCAAYMCVNRNYITN
jgi:hypothetical protein